MTNSEISFFLWLQHYDASVGLQVLFLTYISKSQIPNPKSRTPNPESRIPNPEYQIPNL